LKKIVLLILAALAGYQVWDQSFATAKVNEPIYEGAYVVVYGRDSCGYTQKTLRELDRAGIPFAYEIVDDKETAQLLHTRMEIAGIDTSYYNLPVVDVNNHISIRPTSEEIIETYNGSTQ